MWEKLLHIDRRIIYTIVMLVVLAPFLLKWQQPPSWVNPWTQEFYDFIEELPPGTPVLVSFDYEPATKPELHPMALGICRHVLENDLRLITMSLLPGGVLLAQDATARLGEELGKEKGVDYVNLGFRPGVLQVILGLGENLKRVFVADADGNPTAPQPVLRGVKSYADLGLVVCISGTALPGTWVVFAHQRFKAPVAAGVTSVNAADFYVYLYTRQLIGMINGMAGAAEYESLVGKPEQATLAMPGVSAVHLLMVLLVVVGNIAYFATRGRPRRVEHEPPPPPTGEEV